MDRAKAILRGKFITLSAYIKKKQDFETKDKEVSRGKQKGNTLRQYCGRWFFFHKICKAKETNAKQMRLYQTPKLLYRQQSI